MQEDLGNNDESQDLTFTESLEYASVSQINEQIKELRRFRGSVAYVMIRDSIMNSLAGIRDDLETRRDERTLFQLQGNAMAYRNVLNLMGDDSEEDSLIKRLSDYAKSASGENDTGDTDQEPYGEGELAADGLPVDGSPSSW